MPVFMLSRKLAFPPVHAAEESGLLAVGGDLSVSRLLLAYRSGIFPWPHDAYPFVWCAPDPRFVLYPDRLRVPASLRRVVRKAPYLITYDRDFRGVVEGCRQAHRPGQDGTWILPELVEAYVELHARGYAHSVEAWDGNELIGGLYGVSLGRCFYGESMFARRPDASKCAFVSLVGVLRDRGFTMVDCQVRTEHLARFGAEDVPRARFMRELREALKGPTWQGNWGAGERAPRVCAAG